MVMSINQHTVNAVRRQLWAMNCESYDIAIVRFEDGRSKRQPVGFCTLSGASVLLPDLVRQNARGENVFVRPDPRLDRALVLVDDIEEIDIDTLREKGLEPCCVVETSPKNLQAWIDFGPTPMMPIERKILARKIVELVGADKNSADAVHYGRLAGFTNRKESHFGEGKNGGFPFVRVKDASRLVCSQAPEWRQWAREQATATATAAGIEPQKPRSQVDISKLGEMFSRYCSSWQRNPNHARREDGTDDLSSRDFAVVGRLLREGYDAEKIIPLLADNAKRKNKPLDYARRTVDAVQKSLLDKVAM